MGTIITVSPAGAAPAAKVYDAYFLRNGMRKKDGYETNCVYRLLVTHWATGTVEVVARHEPPVPDLTFDSWAGFQRYFDYYAKLGYTGPVAPVKIP